MPVHYSAPKPSRTNCRGSRGMTGKILAQRVFIDNTDTILLTRPHPRRLHSSCFQSNVATNRLREILAYRLFYQRHHHPRFPSPRCAVSAMTVAPSMRPKVHRLSKNVCLQSFTGCQSGFELSHNDLLSYLPAYLPCLPAGRGALR